MKKTIFAALVASTVLIAGAASAQEINIGLITNPDVTIENINVEAPAAPGSAGRVATAKASNNGDVTVRGLVGAGSASASGKVANSVVGQGASASVDFSTELVNVGAPACDCEVPTFDAKAVATNKGAVDVAGVAANIGNISSIASAANTIAGIGASAAVSAGTSAINR